jgi:hypothetical protein
MDETANKLQTLQLSRSRLIISLHPLDARLPEKISTTLAEMKTGFRASWP